MASRATGCCFLLFAIFAATAGARAEEAFAPRTVTISVFTGSGGSYDAYARLVARHFGNHIPGHPTIIVLNQPGAGGLVATNYAGRVAPKDGTFLTLLSDGLPIFEATDQAGLQVSLRNFQWIGNLSHSNIVTATWYTSDIKNLHDAKTRQVTVGSTGVGSISSLVPKLYNAMLGTRFKVIYGYEGAAQMQLAMERGELDGRGVNTWSSYKADNADDLKEGKLNILIQMGQRKEPDLPNVPLLTELVSGNPKYVELANFMTEAMTLNRAIGAPPGTPENRVAILRAAFDQTMADPEFQDDAKRLGLEISPLPGAEVQDVIDKVLSASANVITTVRALESR